MTRGFDAICTNNEAREHFKECGLTYMDITEGDILSLVLMLNKELKRSNKIGETSVNTMSLSKHIDIKKNTNGTIKTCFLYLNSHYFNRREAISFNEDGFIGFAGWADDGNLNPLKRAFLSWCDELKKSKETEETDVKTSTDKKGYWSDGGTYAINSAKHCYRCTNCGDYVTALPDKVPCICHKCGSHNTILEDHR